MPGPIEIKRQGYKAALYRDGQLIWGPGLVGLAEQKKADIERSERRKQRNCITCGKPFMSEGPHNRMCKSCLAASSSISDGWV